MPDSLLFLGLSSRTKAGVQPGSAFKKKVFYIYFKSAKAVNYMVTCSRHEGLEQEHIGEGVYTIASPECFSVFTTGFLDNRFLGCRVDLRLCPHPGYGFCRQRFCRWFNV